MRPLASLVFIVLSMVLTAVVWPAGNQCAASEVKLRNWYFGIQSIDGQRNQYDVFGREGALPGEVVDHNSQAGLMFGYRFGDRFLLGLQLAVVQHDISGSEDELFDAEALITGTVLFRQRCTLQPFLRGGFGGTSELLIRDGNSGYMAALGTAAVAGGGLQIRLSSRFSLEVETVATFANFLEVSDTSDDKPWPEDSWQVRTSNYGYRIGLGIVVWF